MRYDILKPESVKLIIDCSEKPRDNALFYAFTAAGVLRTPAAWLK